MIFLTIMAYLTIVTLAPWQSYSFQPPMLRQSPVIPRWQTPRARNIPRADLPKASSGRNGPVAQAPAAEPANSTAAYARQAARQRYLDNVYLLAKLIHGEARGEPYVGQVAVGAVVLNRVESPLYPKTLAGVIYQPGAFDAVIDGQITLTPDQETLRAAQDAIGGWDPTGGALFYYNPAKTTSYWIWDRQVILVIGDHYFAR